MCSNAATREWLAALDSIAHVEPLLVWQSRVIRVMPSEWMCEMTRWHRYAIIHIILHAATTVQSLVPPVSCGLASFYSRLTGLTEALEWWYTVTGAQHCRGDMVVHGLLYRLQHTTAAQADFVILRPQPSMHDAVMMPCPVLRMADVACGNVWVRCTDGTGGVDNVLYFKSTADGGARLLCHNIRSGMTTYSTPEHKKNDLKSLGAVFLCRCCATEPPPPLSCVA